jgi:hypothetical protein
LATNPDYFVFEKLPIDNSAGFPQSFSSLFNGITFHFSLYVNIAAERLAGDVDFIELADHDAYLVVHVEREDSVGSRRTVFLRKVVPGLVYEIDQIALSFPVQRVARANLNGRGDAGSMVEGRIANRWA